MTIKNKRYITIQQHDGTEDLYIQIPEELNWKEGDQIEFTVFEEDQAIIIKNTRIAEYKTEFPYNIKQEELNHYYNQIEDWTW